MSSETHDQQPEELRIIGKKYIGRWISALIVLLILLAMGNSMLSNPRFEWSDRNFRDFWLCRRHDPGADAPVIQSGAGRCQLGVYLVFPRGADAGSVISLVQHCRALPDYFDFAAVGW